MQLRRRDPRLTQTTAQFELDPVTFKTLLRDVLFREAGKPYFKHLAIPRRQRWLGAWRTVSTYQAERQLLPVGGRDLDGHIRRFFLTYERLRAVFQGSGMPMSAVQVLRQYCATENVQLAQVQTLECAAIDAHGYGIWLVGGPLLTPPLNDDDA